MTMTPVIPRSRSRKVNGYVKAVLALEAVQHTAAQRLLAVITQATPSDGTADRG
jgi:hypothetical protein